MGFRSRSQVLGSGKVIDLSIPLAGGRDLKRPIMAVEPDYSKSWQKQHLRTIESCYNKSPFYLHYRDELENLVSNRYGSIWELDLATIRWTMKKLKIKTPIAFSDTFEALPPAGTVDLRNRWKPSNRLSSTHEPYQQVFGEQFEPNLSILDLLFNLGPMSHDYLVRQAEKMMKEV